VTVAIVARKGWIRLHRGIKPPVWLRSAGLRALRANGRRLPDLRSGQKLFPRPSGAGSGVGQVAGVHFPGGVEYVANLRDLDSLGIAKAVRDGSRFDVLSSVAVIIGYAIPAFLFAILLIILLAGGRYLDWFPLRGLISDHWADLSWPARIADYFWHLTLPVTAMVIGGFASLTMLTKNAFFGRDQQAIRRHGSRQGIERGAVCCTGMCSATPCYWLSPAFRQPW
jgi:hypothetical protein